MNLEMEELTFPSCTSELNEFSIYIFWQKINT